MQLKPVKKISENFFLVPIEKNQEDSQPANDKGLT